MKVVWFRDRAQECHRFLRLWLGLRSTTGVELHCSVFEERDGETVLMTAVQLDHVSITVNTLRGDQKRLVVPAQLHESCSPKHDKASAWDSQPIDTLVR